MQRILRNSHLSRSISSHTSTWCDAGPLFTEHIRFTGTGLDPPVGDNRLAIILHGLLGSGRNLRTVTTELFKQVSRTSDASWTAVLVDLRNHNKSSNIPDLQLPNTIENTAKDVIDTIKRNWKTGNVDVVIGHSLGGKVALEITQQLAQMDGKENSSGLTPPRQTWCLDSVPGKISEPVTGTSAEVLDVLRTVQSIPLPLPSREALFHYLDASGHRGKAFQQWLASNLKLINKGEYEWAFNVSGVTQMFESYRNTEYWNLLRNPPSCSGGNKTEIHIVKAMKGGRWKGSDGTSTTLNEIASTSDSVFVHELDGLGHWLHAEDPQRVASLIATHVLRIH